MALPPESRGMENRSRARGVSDGEWACRCVPSVAGVRDGDGTGEVAGTALRGGLEQRLRTEARRA